MVQRKVLLGWEMGGGLGHVIPLHRIGEALQRQGFQVVYAVQNLATAALAGIERDKMRQAPHWTPGARQPPLPPGFSGVTFGQLLGLFGLGDPEQVTRMLREWSALLAAERPDAVVSDFAPGLNLAARGRCPLLVFGNGYTVPPHHLEIFPSLWSTEKPLYYDEARLLETVDAVLMAEGHHRLISLPALMAGDRRAIRTFPLLDPYRKWRTETLLAPVLSHIPSPRPVLGDEVLFSMLPSLETNSEIMRALGDLHLPGRLLARDISQASLAKLAGTPWHIERDLVDLGHHLPNLRVVVGYGGLGLSSLALASGLPQLIIYTDNEKFLTAQALQRSGVAIAVSARRADASTLVRAVARLYIDPKIQERAYALALAHAPLLAEDPVASITQMISEIV